MKHDKHIDRIGLLNGGSRSRVLGMMCFMALSVGAAHAGIVLKMPAPAPAPAAATAPEPAKAEAAKTAPAAAPEVVAAPPAPPPPPPVVETMRLVKGKRIDEQLIELARKDGWTMYWNASEFILDQDAVMTGGFEMALTNFLRGANEAGAQLRADFYRGNKTVRITGN